MRRLLYACALILIDGVATADDYSALFEQAVNNINWDFGEEWAYTESVLSEDQLWVGRYDPRRPEGERWTLVSVDGREPTGRERREFLHDRDEHEDSSDDRVTAVVEPDSLELIEETDEYWLFTFVPADDDETFTDNVDSRVKIIKSGPYVALIEMRNTGDIAPGWGTKLTNFHTQLQFAPATDDGPVVPKVISVKVTGRALLFIGIDETEVIKYSDFDYAGD